MEVIEAMSKVLNALGYTKESLAKKLNISTRRAEAILNGTAKSMGMLEYKNYCDSLGVKVGFFFVKKEDVA